MFNILALNNIASIGLTQFPSTQYKISSDASEPDAILVRSAKMHEMQIPKSVKAIGRAGAGVNNIPIEEMTKMGIPVFNTPGANANAVSELVIAGMLLASRHICEAWDYVNHLNLKGSELDKQIEADKKKFAGFELLGKTLGLVGLGSIGVKVANAAVCLGMRVVGYDPTISVNRAWELSANVQQAKSLDDLLAESDFISFHVPLNNETRNMIDASKLNVMKSGVVLLNFARDGIIDNTALASVLQEKKVSVYVNDFPSFELKKFPNVISLPHLGASTIEAEENCAVMVVKQIRDFLENGTISYSVNFPNLDAPPILNGTRISIANANIPNMVAQISSKLASAKLNIQSLSNKSRDSIAYTLIDVDGNIENNLLEELREIEGVIQARVLTPQ